MASGITPTQLERFLNILNYSGTNQENGLSFMVNAQTDSMKALRKSVQKKIIEVAEKDQQVQLQRFLTDPDKTADLSVDEQGKYFRLFFVFFVLWS